MSSNTYDKEKMKLTVSRFSPGEQRFKNVQSHFLFDMPKR